MMKTKPAQPGEEKMFLAKAKDFRDSMLRLLSTNPNSATVLAVNCVISSCDALTAAKLGKISKDLHERIVDLIGKIEEVDKKRKRQVRSVLSVKNKAEYDSRLVSSSEAETAVKQAERFFDWVRTLIQ